MGAEREDERMAFSGPIAKMNGAEVLLRSRRPLPESHEVQFLQTASACNLLLTPTVLLLLSSEGQSCSNLISLAYDGSACRVAILGLMVTPVPFSLAYAAKMRASFISEPMPTAPQACPSGTSMWKYRSPVASTALRAKINRCSVEGGAKTNVAAVDAFQAAVCAVAVNAMERRRKVHIIVTGQQWCLCGTRNERDERKESRQMDGWEKSKPQHHLE